MSLRAWATAAGFTSYVAMSPPCHDQKPSTFPSAEKKASKTRATGLLGPSALAFCQKSGWSR